MKAAFVLLCLCFAVSAVAQEKAQPGQPERARVEPACGPVGESYKVSLDRTHRGLLPLVAGTAQVYFIHDSGIPFENLTLGYPVTKYAVDGSWVGAGHGDSWFEIQVAPGEHHVCATLQSSFVNQRVELGHFTAEAGKAYFLRTRLVMSQSVELLELEQMDSDQGKYLVARYPMSVSHLKK
jgi:hypothetical protein